MPAIINTNIASLNAQRNLNSSQSALQTSLQRLSSGLRINSAKDDAAGLAISERFSTQIRGLNQAARNANDGISLAQTGEGALAAVTDNLQRIRELAVQAANSTNSADDRAALQLEVAQRLAEIDRTATQTSFNGQKLLDGTFTAAAFQIGANAGETISVNGLGTGVRLSATGQIAQATSGVLAAGATNGSISTGVINTTNFGTAASNATAGQISFTVADTNFAAALTAGTSTPQTVTAFDFRPAAVATAATATTLGAVTGADWTAAGAGAHMQITDDTGTYDIGLDSVSWAGNETGMATFITNALAAAGSNTVASIGGGGELVLTSGETGVGATVPSFTAGATIAAAGITPVGIVNVNGADATPDKTATFSIDGTAITLNTNAATLAGTRDAINTAIGNSALADKANYSAAVVGSDIVITHAGSTTAVAISGANANALAFGFTNSAGVAGSPAGTNANLNIGGQAVALTTNYAGDYAAMAADIDTAMGVGFTVTNNGSTITVARDSTGVSSTAVDIAGADAAAITALGLSGAAVPGTPGADAQATTNATFYVDGNAVTLATDYADPDGAGALTAFDAMATDITSQLTGYTATNTAGSIKIEKTGSLAAVSITGADANATAAGFIFGTGTAGTSSGSVTLGAGELTVAGTAIAAGTYASVADLATYINANATGVYASEGTGADAGKLVVSSASAITLGGTQVTGTIGFAATSYAANSGTLATASVVDAASANLTIQRIDAALTSVSNLRSTFGAVQNRFESVISSLTATSENLTAARSRIQDTDFAAETAQLTRNQILQQAGTAMLAQANQLPNTVLSLLR